MERNATGGASSMIAGCWIWSIRRFAVREDHVATRRDELTPTETGRPSVGKDVRNTM
jgi:hypothetical protein